MAGSGRIILISPVGDVDPAVSKSVQGEIGRVFGYPTEMRLLLDDVSFAFDANRNQYHSTPILEKLDGLASAEVLKILAITRVDLFIPILTHVYGEAQLGGRASIVSLHRLGEDLSPAAGEAAFRERVNKEAVHELGHTFKLLHCKDKTCIMHYCRKISDVDRKSGELCRYCKILMGDEVKRLGGG